MADQADFVVAERRYLIRLRDRGIKAERLLAMMDKTLEQKSRLSAHRIKWLYQAAFDARMALEHCRSVNEAVVARLKELNERSEYGTG